MKTEELKAQLQRAKEALGEFPPELLALDAEMAEEMKEEQAAALRNLVALRSIQNRIARLEAELKRRE